MRDRLSLRLSEPATDTFAKGTTAQRETAEEAERWALEIATDVETVRASADVSAVADPTTGVNVYDSIPYPYEEAGEKLTTVLHWVPICGTSVASPIIASMFAPGASGFLLCTFTRHADPRDAVAAG